MPNFTLRLDDALYDLVAEAAREEDTSIQQFIRDALWDAVSPNGEIDPGIVLGYVELRGGELGSDVDCPECGMPLERPHVGFLAGRHPIAFGPVCHICATTD